MKVVKNWKDVGRLAKEEVIQLYKGRKEARRIAKEEVDKAKKGMEIKEAKERELDKQYRDALEKVILFAGDIKEYESFRGYESGSIVACTADQEIFIREFDDGRAVGNYDTKLRNRLIDEGMEALVNAKPIVYSSDHYFAKHGLPVKKAE